MSDQIIRVGTGVIVLNDKNQLLAGKRKSKHGEGTWGLVGGHVDFGETLEECAYREALEETGLEIGDIKVITTVTNFFENKSKHYVTVFLAGRITGGTLEIKEPDKVESWKFFDHWNQLPQPLFVDYPKDVPWELVKDYIG
jgi:8-oxo-dGTP diphosphatase